MTKTVHVVPASKGWTVKRVGEKSASVFSTKGEAVESARTIARRASSGQLVIYGRDGRIQQQSTYGMPKIQDLPDGSSQRIENAVKRVARKRLLAGDRASSRG